MVSMEPGLSVNTASLHLRTTKRSRDTVRLNILCFVRRKVILLFVRCAVKNNSGYIYRINCCSDRRRFVSGLEREKPNDSTIWLKSEPERTADWRAL